MELEQSEKLVISKLELRDRRIDEAILLQRSSVPGVIEPIDDKPGRFRIFYAAWFYLMLAGAAGAFAAWAIVEPFFDDGLAFVGQIEEVDLINVRQDLRRIRVAGVDVYVATRETTIETKDLLTLPETTITHSEGISQRLSVDDLHKGQIIRVLAHLQSFEGGMLAWAIQLEPQETLALKLVSPAEIFGRFRMLGFFWFPLVAGLAGFAVGGAEGAICRTLSRAVRCGLIGLCIGLAGGVFSVIAAGIASKGFAWVIGGFVYLMTGDIPDDPTESFLALFVEMHWRASAWAIAGSAIGLGQGFALKSGRLLLNGFIGGVAGGTIGGLLFDPIYILFSDAAMPGAEVSRALGLTLIGGMTGLMIGLTNMLTRSAWLKVTGGPLRGKEFNFDRVPIRIGSSPKNEIYLFKDSKIAPLHAEVYKLRDTYEIRDRDSSSGTFVNRRRIARCRLSEGDRIRIGNSEFVYLARGCDS